MRKTKDIFLIFGGEEELRIHGFTDSDFMLDVDDRKSTLGCVFLCNRGSMNWKSFKQPIITNSIIEVEYITTSEIAKKALWFKKFIMKISIILSDAITLSMTIMVS